MGQASSAFLTANGESGMAEIQEFKRVVISYYIIYNISMVK
jgi:hypothetical protein